MKIIPFLIIISIFAGSCASLRAATTVRNGAIQSYKYIFISPTGSLTSGFGVSYGGQSYASSKTVNPADIIPEYYQKRVLSGCLS